MDTFFESSWYYVRYLDAHDTAAPFASERVDPWLNVDQYIGGAEHAVLHLLYARFWHKVLFDLGHVSTPEPFRKLVNQGTILGEAEFTIFETANKKPVSAADVEVVGDPVGEQIEAIVKSTGEKVFGRRIDESEVERVKDGWVLKSNPVIRIDSRSFKMSKSRGNVVNPDKIVEDYGTDAFRLYEMYLGPLEQQKPWNTRDIVGMSRFLASVYRNLIGEEGSASRIAAIPIPENLDRMLHRAIKKVADDIVALRFNTAIAELIKLNNELIHEKQIPRELAETFAVMLAPFAPHLGEEIWQSLGHHKSLGRRPWPVYDPAKLTDTTLEIPVQVNGKLRDKIVVDINAGEEEILAKAAGTEKIAQYLAGKTVRKRLYVPKKLVNFVV
jgi:leucyl-tRNA synthetase